MSLWPELGALLGGALLGGIAGLFLRRIKPGRAFLLAAGPLGAAVWYAWLTGRLGPAASALGPALLGGFLAACDALCRARSARLLFLILCAGAGLQLFNQTAGRAALASDCARMRPVVVEGVTLQQTSYTCVPASTATCLMRLGLPATEAALAWEAGTTSGGTSTERMARFLSRRLADTPWRAECRPWTWETLPRDGTPAVLDGVYGGIPHAIAFLGFEGDRVVLGDPMVGREVVAHGEFEARCKGRGIFFSKEVR